MASPKSKANSGGGVKKVIRAPIKRPGRHSKKRKASTRHQTFFAGGRCR